MNPIGLRQLQIDGEVYRAKGSFTYNLGGVTRTTIMGADAPHGHTEEPRVAFIEGEITDSDGLSVKDLTNIRDSTVSVTMRNGKMIVLTDAYYTGSGDVQTQEGNIAFRVESLLEGEEVLP